MSNLQRNQALQLERVYDNEDVAARRVDQLELQHVWNPRYGCAAHKHDQQSICTAMRGRSHCSSLRNCCVSHRGALGSLEALSNACVVILDESDGA